MAEGEGDGKGVDVELGLGVGVAVGGTDGVGDSVASGKGGRSGIGNSGLNVGLGDDKAVGESTGTLGVTRFSSPAVDRFMSTISRTIATRLKTPTSTSHNVRFDFFRLRFKTAK